MKTRRFFVAMVFFGFVTGLIFENVEYARGGTGELEKFIKARIDIGEWMREYMKGIRYDEQGTEDLGKMEEEINVKVAEILDTHGLTIDEYEKRAAIIFKDEEAVNAFLDTHPELKEKYMALPMHGMRGGGAAADHP